MTISSDSVAAAADQIKAARRSPFGWIVALLLLIWAVCFFGKFGQPIWGGAADEPVNRVAIVNTAILIEAKSLQVYAEKIQLEPDSFADAIHSITFGLADKGYVVMNASSVMAAPASVDLTEFYAQRLGVQDYLSKAIEERSSKKSR